MIQGCKNNTHKTNFIAKCDFLQALNSNRIKTQLLNFLSEMKWKSSFSNCSDLSFWDQLVPLTLIHFVPLAPLVQWDLIITLFLMQSNCIWCTAEASIAMQISVMSSVNVWWLFEEELCFLQDGVGISTCKPVATKSDGCYLLSYLFCFLWSTVEWCSLPCPTLYTRLISHR